MPAQEVLTLVTLVMAIVSMSISSLALLPHVKPGLAVVRDAVLWGAMVAIFLAILVVGWHHVQRGMVGPAGEEAVATDPAAPPGPL